MDIKNMCIRKAFKLATKKGIQTIYIYIYIKQHKNDNIFSVIGILQSLISMQFHLKYQKSI